MEVTSYVLSVRDTADYDILNDAGLDARIFGKPSIPVEPFPYLNLSLGTYAQVAGSSQRDECLGDLDLCLDGMVFQLG